MTGKVAGSSSSIHAFITEPRMVGASTALGQWLRRPATSTEGVVMKKRIATFAVGWERCCKAMTRRLMSCPVLRKFSGHPGFGFRVWALILLPRKNQVTCEFRSALVSMAWVLACGASWDRVFSVSYVILHYMLMLYPFCSYCIRFCSYCIRLYPKNSTMYIIC